LRERYVTKGGFSYTLTVSFALGTNPDINTVNVNCLASVNRPSVQAPVGRIGARNGFILLCNSCSSTEISNPHQESMMRSR
jgi:hypothetical protein